MSDRIHEDEPDTSEAAVGALLTSQCPELADLPLTYLATTGTSNAAWRVHTGGADDDLVVRLPRTDHAAGSMRKELGLLPGLADSELAHTLSLPRLRHAGSPTDSFPYPWAVLEWLAGDDAWTLRADPALASDQFAIELAEAVRTIGSLRDLPVRDRKPGSRGGPLIDLLAALDRWLDDPQWHAADLIDVTAVRRSAAESAEVAGDSIPKTFLHGDLYPGNLLLGDGQLSAVIDWGGAGYGDPAQDLAPAWSMLEARGRQVFRDALAPDDATWLRARAFELEHAVGGILYYRPRGHPLADVMERTLGHVLGEPG